MDKLWAPWRINYVRAKKLTGCIFCKARRPGVKSYLVFKTRHSVCMLNAFPYNNGHLMVSPIRHKADLSELTEIEALDLFRSINKAKSLLEKVLQPQGYNIGINISSASGAGIAGHLHVHIVPRWFGDTNFMPVVFGTKVVSQSLEELKRKLKDAESEAD